MSPTTSTPQPLLATRSLSIGYNPHTPILQDLNLSLRAGRIAVLIGGNGAGKSTLLRTLAGSLKPLAGEIIINGTPLQGIPRSCLARLMAIVTTDPTMAGGLTVEETVAIGRQPYTGIFGRLSPQDREIVAEALRATGIDHKANQPLACLSDGERQKAMIARALAQRTPLLLMDEPTSFLDVAARIRSMALLRSLADNAAGRMSIIISTHDIAPALDIADDIWAFDPDNKTIIAGPKETIIASGALDVPFARRGIRFDPTHLDYKPSK
ncbi:MAG: ABC transporter ATP-binding protein [Muribaculaceae bacterium]|nr:ABC transporter ATP-binding protein [Muribaculaceae bacterium]